MIGLDPTGLTCACLYAAAAAGLGWYSAKIAKQITYVTLADGRRQARQLPLIFRLLLPLAQNFRQLFEKPVFAKAKEKVEGKIISAGFDGLITADEFLALRLLMPIFLGFLFWIPFVAMSASAAPGSFIDKSQNMLYLAGFVWFYMYPELWLRQVLALRHKMIQRALPFVLDLLTLSVEAGLDFMTALQRNIDRRAVDALGEELIRVVREIQLGKTRREALRDLSKRVNLQDLRSVVNALVQADELGVSIGSILRILSDQMRQRRFERAEKLANEAPVKLLLPLIGFIFPAVFVILMGPIAYKLFSQGF